MDVFAPCALGGILSAESVRNLRAKLICGAANNQLAGPEISALIARKGITYLPDYVVNAGGIVKIASEILKIADPDWVARKLAGLSVTVEEILDEAARQDGDTAAVADRIARARIARSDRLAA